MSRRKLSCDPFGEMFAQQDQEDRLAELYAAMENMHADDRRVLEMRFLKQLSNHEVAMELGVTDHAARMRFHRAKARLSELVQD